MPDQPKPLSAAKPETGDTAMLRGGVTTEQIQQDLHALVVGEIQTAYRDIAKAVERAGRCGSALHGLEVVAAAFAAVLDTYANPNALNPEGMCDDPAVFRLHFAEIVAAGATGAPTRRKPTEGQKPSSTGV